MSNWTPAINTTSEILGVILLFIPYIIILLPFLQDRIVTSLEQLYLHHTPRNDWNDAVNQAPPRRLMGYLCAILFIFTSIWLLLINNHVNNYWLDFFQYFIYLSIPLLLSIIRPPSGYPCNIFDILIILFVIVPIEISQEYTHFLPDIQFTIYKSWGYSPKLSVLRITAFNLFLFIFYIFRPLQHIGLTWNLFTKKYKNRLWVLWRFIIIISLFLAFAISFCVIPGIKYLHSPEHEDNVWRDGIFRYFCLFFLDILLYEFLYRGVIQNLLHSAFDFRHEARSYLRGGNRNRVDSLTDILNHYDNSVKLDETESPKDPSELLWNNGDGKQKQAVVDVTTSINHGNNKVEANALPYYDNNDDDEFSTFDDENNNKLNNNDISNNTFLLKFDEFRDWFILIISSFIYAITIIDYKDYDNTKDLFYGGILMWWLGFCCGWLFRLTNSCFISAIFNSLIIFNFKYVFNTPNDFCNGAC